MTYEPRTKIMGKGRVCRLAPAVSLLCAVAGLQTVAAAPTKAAELLRGRCYMDICSWFSIEERSIVGSNSQGALFKVSMRGWESRHPDGTYDRPAPRKGGQISTSYHFCSRPKPAVIVPTDRGGWQVDYLALNTPYGPPGALENVTATYYAVCHGVAASNPAAFVELGRRFGYLAMEEAPEGSPIARPEDILRP
ncbi:hypothetical protein [Methylobacterium iners]|uniref:Uncharacterized protein n=1 Tax=Methylobacterium iners TaxID=418707 RepID=A0ABQ4RU71_9HYPH|nr:hypothetical protein [Methylobacterium iners]GJD93147.1 hypothetical protein OCOJLMKI_0337 [Methylobacterium iners]